MLTRSEQLAYLAGFIDGEGYLALQKGKSPNGNVKYRPLLRISQKYRQPLDFVATHFGGKITQHTWSSGRSHYRWALGGSELLEVLEELEPYLILKRDQALELLKVKLRPGNWQTDYTPMEERAVIHQRLKRMHS